MAVTAAAALELTHFQRRHADHMLPSRGRSLALGQLELGAAGGPHRVCDCQRLPLQCGLCQNVCVDNCSACGDGRPGAAPPADLHCELPLPPPLPTPVRQTPTQRRLFAAVNDQAAIASAAARPHVVALLESAEFVAALGGCCPELRAMPSGAARLAWFDEETLATEQVHNFTIYLSRIKNVSLWSEQVAYPQLYNIFV